MAVGSTNDLNPASLIWVRRNGTCGRCVASPRRDHGGGAAGSTPAPESEIIAEPRAAEHRERDAKAAPRVIADPVLDRVARRDLAAVAPPACSSRGDLAAGSGRRRRGSADGTRSPAADRADSAPRRRPPCAPCRSSPGRAPRRAASACTGAAARANSARRRRELDDAAEVHHADAIGDVMDHREVVRDEEVGEAAAALQVAHQVQHLRLHRDVERGGRLVADEEPRLAWRARARSRSAAAGRPRTGADTSRRRRRASPTCVEQRRDAGSELPSRPSPVPARGSARRRCRRRASAD